MVVRSLHGHGGDVAAWRIAGDLLGLSRTRPHRDPLIELAAHGEALLERREPRFLGPSERSSEALPRAVAEHCDGTPAIRRRNTGRRRAGTRTRRRFRTVGSPDRRAHAPDRTRPSDRRPPRSAPVSMNCPSPVRRRCSSAASTATAPSLPATWSGWLRDDPAGYGASGMIPQPGDAGEGRGQRSERGRLPERSAPPVALRRHVDHGGTGATDPPRSRDPSSATTPPRWFSTTTSALAHNRSAISRAVRHACRGRRSSGRGSCR